MLLGGASATQTMLDAIERGASDNQAIGLGLLSGAFEIFFEKYELDSLLDNVKRAGKGAARDAFVKSMARQALSEGVGQGPELRPLYELCISSGYINFSNSDYFYITKIII